MEPYFFDKVRADKITNRRDYRVSLPSELETRAPTKTSGDDGVDEQNCEVIFVLLALVVFTIAIASCLVITEYFASL